MQLPVSYEKIHSSQIPGLRVGDPGLLLTDETGATWVPGPGGVYVKFGESGSASARAFTSRALGAGDSGASLTVAAAQTASLVAGLGTSFSCAFYNTSNAPVILTIAVPAGVTCNGVTNGSVTRTIPAYGVTAIQATAAADVYIAPGA